jgi:hypothetical protein
MHRALDCIFRSPYSKLTDVNGLSNIMSILFHSEINRKVRPSIVDESRYHVELYQITHPDIPKIVFTPEL